MIRQIAKMARLLTLPLLALGASACTGSVNLDVTDAPVDKAKKVVVQFSGATFQPTGANAVSVTFDPPLSIDLLALRDGNTASLISASGFSSTKSAMRGAWCTARATISPG